MPVEDGRAAVVFQEVVARLPRVQQQLRLVWSDRITTCSLVNDGVQAIEHRSRVQCNEKDLGEITRHVLTALTVATVAVLRDLIRKQSSRCSFGTFSLGKHAHICITVKAIHAR